MLSNPEKRQQYDQYGDQSAASNTPQQSSHSRHGHHRSFHRDFEADISPEELFNIFFGGRFPTGERLFGWMKSAVTQAPRGVCKKEDYLQEYQMAL